ncbi:MAG: response regulator transcription factor [Bacteroidia bacterium]|nr:response regulator transcription factor [Bacteroidia bacterium]
MLKKEILLYGLISFAILSILNASHYTIFLGTNKTEVYISVAAVLLLGIGIYFGYKLVGKSASSEPEENQLSLNRKKNSIGLSNRELEVLELMAKGHTNQEIGDALFISLPTVKTHASNIYEKMDVKRRTQAVQKGIDLGLVEPRTLV